MSCDQLDDVHHECIGLNELAFWLGLSHLLCDQIGFTACLQSFHMRPTGILAEHFDIDQSNEKLLQPSLVHFWIFQPGLEDLDFLANERVLLSFRFALPYSSDQ